MSSSESYETSACEGLDLLFFPRAMKSDGFSSGVCSAKNSQTLFLLKSILRVPGFVSFHKMIAMSARDSDTSTSIRVQTYISSLSHHAPVIPLPYVSMTLKDARLTYRLGSEEMVLVQLFIPSEIARSAVSLIGEAGCVQFLDVPLPSTPPF